jgi:hypothetical protein
VSLNDTTIDIYDVFSVYMTWHWWAGKQLRTSELVLESCYSQSFKISAHHGENQIHMKTWNTGDLAHKMETEAAAAPAAPADDDRVAMDRSRAKSNHGDHDDADHNEFSGMDVEDWLAKQHELAARSQAREGRDALKPAGALQRKQSTPREAVIDSSSSSSVGFLLGDGHHQTRKLSPAPSRPPPQHDPGERKPSLKYSPSRLYEDPLDEEGAGPQRPGEPVLDASIRCIQNTDDFYIAELTGTSQNDGLLVVDGVRTTNPKVKRMLQLSCALAAASLLAVVAGMITTRLVNPAPAAMGIPPSSTNDTDLGAKPQNYSTAGSIQGNLNWTIAEAAIAAESKGLFPTAMFLSPSSREIFFEKFNRTDLNFTGFTVKSGGIQIFDGLDISLLSKMLTDPWIGHVVSQPPALASLPSRQHHNMYHDLNSLSNSLSSCIANSSPDGLFGEFVRRGQGSRC